MVQVLGGSRDGGDLDFAGFAQEFLRRNPAYVREYRMVMRIGGSSLALTEQEEMARRWGLTFSV